MKITILVIGGVIIATLAYILIFVDGDTQPGVEVGENQGVIALEFEDYDGKEVSLADFAGTPLVVNSWATWCPFCVNELPDFAAAQEELGDSVIIIAIDRQESMSAAKKFSDNLGVTNDMVFWIDSSDSFYREIGGFSMPETIFINAQGETIDHKRGPMDKEEIIERIQAIL